MSKQGGVKIEFDGKEFNDLTKALANLPGHMDASMIRTVARKPGNKIASAARKLFTRKRTGDSKRSIGILKVKNPSQKFIEVGVKGKSLAYIWMFFRGGDRQKKTGASTGSITPVGNVVEKAAKQMGSTALKEMSVNLNSVMKRVLRKYNIR